MKKECITTIWALRWQVYGVIIVALVSIFK